MKLKEKWLIALIALVVIVGMVVAVKYLPVYVTVLAILTTIFGQMSGWYVRGLWEKYFPKNKTE